MNAPAPVLVAHAVERRVRLLVPALAGHREVCQRIAEQLASAPGCERVTSRPVTGSVIVEADGGRLDPERLRERLVELLRDARGDDGRPLTRPPAEAHPGPTRIARAIAHAFSEINADVREATHGRADLGTILPVVFAAAGIAEIGVTGKLPVPTWFNLLWWSIRAFMTFNESAVEDEHQHAGGQQGAARPSSASGAGASG